MGNFTKEYEITRRETQRFYHETWKDMKSFAQKHTQLRSGEFRTKMKEQYVENMARLIRLVQLIRFNLKSLLLAGATTRELVANFLLLNCADAHTQHNKKFD